MSRSAKEFSNHFSQLESISNDDFISYINGYIKKKNKWVFFYMDPMHRTIRTNMHVESFHKTLKYNYLNGKKNRRADKLIFKLLEISKDFQYKENIQNQKGVRSTFKRKISERHNLVNSIHMKISDNFQIQVLLKRLIII